MSLYRESSVHVSSCVTLSDSFTIHYAVFPEQDIIELSLGVRDALAMQTSEAGLRHCVAAFMSALDAFSAAAAQVDEAHADFVPSADPLAARAEA